MQTLAKASIFAFTLVVVLLGSGCKPTDTTTPDPSPEVCQVALIKEGGVNYFRAEYDSQHRVTKLISYNNGSISNSEEFIYDNSGNITQETSKDAAGITTGRGELIYNSSGKIFQIKGYDNAGVLSHQTTNEYDASQRITRQNYSSLSNAVLAPSSYRTYEYSNTSKFPSRSIYFSPVTATTGSITTYTYDGNNNMTEETDFHTPTGGGSSTVATRYLRTYDDKNVPFVILGKLGKIALFGAGSINYEISRNNILTETIISYNTSGQETSRSINNRTYEYDSKGNPTKRNLTNSSGSTAVQTVEYHCH